MKLMDGIVFTIESKNKGQEIEITESELITCKNCKYFELDHFDNLNGIPFITSHEVCTKWGRGCKTSKDGYCFMAERKEE